jgi:hypothetical protein
MWAESNAYALDSLIVVSVFVAVVRVEALDLTGKFRFDDRYCDLPLVSDVKPGHACSDARLF